MKQIIMDVLDDMSNSQVNLASEAARKTVSSLISAALKTKGSYIVFTDSEIEEQKVRETWVCSICGENTFDVDYEYLGTLTNHLGCELRSQKEIDEYVEDIDEQAYAQGRKSSVDEKDDSDFYTGPERREKNWLQKKHEDKVFGGDTGIDADFRNELESHKLADEIVDNKDEKWIYESPDGGKTVFRRPFSDYDPKNKEEIDFKTKEPTGRKFTEYNGGKWNE